MATVDDTPKYQPATMRPARLTDHAAMARCLSLAFYDEVLFGERIHPHRAQYPLDNDLYWLRWIQVYWWDWSHVFFVTVDVDDKTKKEVVTGVAHWCRMTAKPPAEVASSYKLASWDPRNVMVTLAKAYTSVTARIWPNRAADPAQEDVIERSYHFLDHVWTGSHSESWYLESLGVHPGHQKRGIGRKLVQWGLNQAEKEGVSASVISAYGKDNFYQACGFDVGPIGSAGDGEGNPLKDVPGGNIFFREPK